MTTVASSLSALQITKEESLLRFISVFLCPGVRLFLVHCILMEERHFSILVSVRFNVLWEEHDAVRVYSDMYVLVRSQNTDMTVSLLGLVRGECTLQDLYWIST